MYSTSESYIYASVSNDSHAVNIHHVGCSDLFHDVKLYTKIDSCNTILLSGKIHKYLCYNGATSFAVIAYFHIWSI